MRFFLGERKNVSGARARARKRFKFFAEKGFLINPRMCECATKFTLLKIKKT